MEEKTYPAIDLPIYGEAKGANFIGREFIRFFSYIVTVQINFLLSPFLASKVLGFQSCQTM